jgi:hypothetical protein
METYKKFTTALKNNPFNNPIIRILGNKSDALYVVVDDGPMSRFTELALIKPDDPHVVEAYVSVSKFAALGNANWATPKEGQRTHSLKFD